ncbi:NAD(P)H-dependent glycerol-3-phosphate dehydrogenase [Neisseria sp. Ec49-e6-T10]|uniref:NAD(P)H-dependent glycerol-3-phosphate dehydrogenase n=1 Tax=Neisseria sp. Ec49-e6-T10 TaxID=3140744 RepID=UPI003EBA449A
MKLCIIGAGAWGTALAIHFARYFPVFLWERKPEYAVKMQEERENHRYLKAIQFPEQLIVTNDLEKALNQSTLILCATPIAALRETLAKITQLKQNHLPFLWACKGFERQTGLLPHQIVSEEWPEHTEHGVLSGPSFAQEVAQGLPCAVSLASLNTPWLENLVQKLNTPIMRLYANNDLIGVEVGGALKNIMAIATGVSDGLNYGLNARAALITRGLAEISRLAQALGGKPSTMMGLSGMGDLILTCTGNLSRNRQVGLMLAQGKKLSDVLNDLGHVAEGVPTTYEAKKLSEQYQIDMPITHALCDLLDEKVYAKELIEYLMGREPKSEYNK